MRVREGEGPAEPKPVRNTGSAGASPSLAQRRTCPRVATTRLPVKNGAGMSEFPAQQVLEEAARFHQAGQLGEAISRYRQILQSRPSHVEAMLRLGIALHQHNRSDEAVGWLEKAVQLVGDKAWTVGTGGVNETTVIPIAKTGVKQIAIGGIVHSAAVIDISIDIGEMKVSAKREIAKERAMAS